MLAEHSSISYLTHYDPVYWIFLLLSSLCKKQTSASIISRNWAPQTPGHTPKHLTQVKMSAACLKQYLFTSSLATSHLQTLGSNSSISHICQIRSLWPAYEVLRKGPLLRKPFLLAVFCPPHICKRWYGYHHMLVHWSKHSEWLLQAAIVQSDIMEIQFFWYFNVTFVFPYERERRGAS